MTEPNALQKQAIEYLDGPLLVLAGPGTGKTELLSRKVTYILKHTDAIPDNILCLTFTDSAAANMRDRLASIIGKDASKVNIYTYHSFGVAILAAYKNYATKPFRNLDEAISDVTQYKIIREIQQKLPAGDILKSDNIRDIIDTISSAKSARLTSKDLAKIAKDNTEQDQDINQAVQKHFDNLVPRMKFQDGLNNVYLPLLKTLVTFTSKTEIVKGVEKKANIIVRELNSIIDEESAKDKPSIAPLTKWRNDHFEKDDAGNYCLKDRVANLKLASIANVMQQYEAYLEAHGLFDFSDMIEEALRFLKTDDGFRMTLSERFQYIMLDEFQDTNTAQSELIRAITDYEKPCVMAVGDDDQAIFAFQGANASNLLDFENHYHAKVIVLTDNYRSSGNILSLSRKIADQLETSFAKGRNVTKNLTPQINYADTKISRHEFIESTAEYYWVADKINQLITSGVKQSDIAIITPKHKYVAPLLPYLKSHPSINIAYEKRDNVFEDSKIHQLLTIAKFIHNLATHAPAGQYLLEILAFDFWDISTKSIIDTINYQPSKLTLDYLLESDDQKIKLLGEFFSELIIKSVDTPLELFIDYIIGAANIRLQDGSYTSPFLEYYKSLDNFETFELYENLYTLREAIKSYTKTSSPKLIDLITMLEDYEAADKALVNTSPYQDANDAIQVLTAHKSKGLEFAYVFLIATDNRAWGKAKGNNNFLVLPKNLRHIRHTGTTDDELLRLFFVAITRAKHHLYMTNSIKDFSGKPVARLDYLSESSRKDEDNREFIDSPFLPKPIVTLHYQELPSDKKLSNLQNDWIYSYQKLDNDINSILKKRLENYQLTATDLTTFIDIIYAGPAVFYERKILRAPNDNYSTSITFGNLIHATFEKITNDNLDNQAAIKFFRETALASDISPEDLEDILENGESSLKASLNAFGDILRHQNAKAEVNLHHEHLNLKGIPLTGKIDHININEKDKTIELYDFKTSNYNDKNWYSHPTLYKYAMQLSFYKLLLNLSPTYSKYTVTRGHILFVSPDKVTGKVYDKVYDFDEHTEDDLKQLITSTYKHIKSLDFVENDQLFVQPDSTKSLKDLKDFIKTILDTN